MPWKVRDANLKTRKQRLKLKAGQRYWAGIRGGVALGYRRGTQGAGSWSLRILLADGRYGLRAIADADDRAVADGVKVLNFAQAQKRAADLADQIREEEGSALTSATLAEVAEKYLVWFRAYGKAGRANPDLLVRAPEEIINRRIGTLSAADLRAWLDYIAKSLVIDGGKLR